MREPIKNIVASFQARLKNEAERQGRPFTEILQYYVLERFLFRFAQTQRYGPVHHRRRCARKPHESNP